MAVYSHPFKIELLELHKFSRWHLTSAEENRIVISRMWTQICRILKWIQISIMFFNSAINPKSACLTTHFLRGPNCNQTIAWNVYYTWSGRWAISTAVISFHLFGLKVHQFAPGNEFSSPHPIYIYSQLSDFMGWLSSLAQANLTSLSSGSDAVIFGGVLKEVSRGLWTDLSASSPPCSLWLSSAPEALPLGTKQASRLISPRAPSATNLSHLHLPMAFAELPPLQGCPQGVPLRELLSPSFPSVTPNPNAGCKLQIEASLESFAILVSNPHTKQKQHDHCANIALKP